MLTMTKPARLPAFVATQVSTPGLEMRRKQVSSVRWSVIHGSDAAIIRAQARATDSPGNRSIRMSVTEEEALIAGDHAGGGGRGERRRAANEKGADVRVGVGMRCRGGPP